jgi:hypothetical protein
MIYFYTMSAEYTMNQTTENDTVEKNVYRAEIPLVQLKEMYVDSLSPKEKKAYLIARDHLGMSFTLEKSVGFLQWKKSFLE